MMSLFYVTGKRKADDDNKVLFGTLDSRIVEISKK
jgi:hypothetical protein